MGSFWPHRHRSRRIRHCNKMSEPLECTVTVGEYTLSYLDRPGSADAPPLLFVHGFLDSRKSWTKVISGIAPGRRLLALTLRGWGDSCKAGPYTVDSYAADVIAFMDALSISEAVYCGHSMGTLIGPIVAAHSPDRIISLVLCSAADKLRPYEVIIAEGDDACTAKDLIDPAALGIVAGAAATCGELPEEAQAVLCEFQECEDRTAVTMVETFKADPGAVNGCWMDMLDEDHTSLLADVKCPVLICWGEEDLLFQKNVQDRLIAALTNTAETTFVAVPGASHDGLLGEDAPAAAVAIEINKFVSA